ncbi:MAG: hypothetical protein CMH83_21415 [Nocardioides sp.]|nr:hypothetical protein [Nocardioides sp.]
MTHDPTTDPALAAGDPPPEPAPAAPSRRGLLWSLALVLAVATVVLSTMVVQAAQGDPADRVEVGESVAVDRIPYGLLRRVVTPYADVEVLVADPRERVPFSLLQYDYGDPRREEERGLVAPEGGVLVPLSWSIRSTLPYDQTFEGSVDVELVAGDERQVIGSLGLAAPSSSTYARAEPHPVVLALGRDAELDDLALEVTFDGLTQRVDVTTGRRAPGPADLLYTDGPDLTAGCTEVEDWCAMTAGPGSDLATSDGTFTASWVSLYAWDRELGWAPEGSRWAAVRLQLFGVDVVQGRGGGAWYLRGRQAREPQVRLDGREPVRREDLEGGRSTGRVVFEVPADGLPQELGLSLVQDLPRDAPARTLRLSATLALRPIG